MGVSSLQGAAKDVNLTFYEYTLSKTIHSEAPIFERGDSAQTLREEGNAAQSEF
jgi:hypothetical protein